MFEPEVNAALQDLTEKLGQQFPEFKDILQQAKAEGWTEAETMARLMPLMGQHAKVMEQLAEEVLAPLRSPSTAIAMLENVEPAPILFTKDKLVRLNPMVEAAILERVQFDGDIPEMRSGPLPQGGFPAVPVESTARNPVMLGAMLQAAADEVVQEMSATMNEYSAEAYRLTEGLSEETALQVLKDNLPAPPTGVPGYEAGQLPVPRTVTNPSGSALAAMTPEDQRVAAYKALSTTQGRRSALRVIEELVLVGLESEGYPMRARAPTRTSDVPVYAEWTVQLSGAEATQPNFSFIDLAAKALIRKLVPQLKVVTVRNPVLEVMPVNTVDVRQVGWAARIVEV